MCTQVEFCSWEQLLPLPAFHTFWSIGKDLPLPLVVISIPYFLNVHVLLKDCTFSEEHATTKTSTSKLFEASHFLGISK
jgi:hypothetical protein